MIPELPSSIDPKDMLEFYEKLIARLDGQSGVHVMWHTHKRDPSVCWICDTQILTYKVLAICKDLLQSPPLDNETGSEDDSDLESEIDDIEWPSDRDIKQGYNEPEYNVDEDGYRNKEEFE